MIRSEVAFTVAEECMQRGIAGRERWSADEHVEFAICRELRRVDSDDACGVWNRSGGRGAERTVAVVQQNAEAGAAAEADARGCLRRLARHDDVEEIVAVEIAEGDFSRARCVVEESVPER